MVDGAVRDEGDLGKFTDALCERLKDRKFETLPLYLAPFLGSSEAVLTRGERGTTGLIAIIGSLSGLTRA